jgi:hypothetical protein
MFIFRKKESMNLTLEQIIALLETTDAAAAKALRDFVTAKDGEISKAKGDLKTLKIKAKEDFDKATASSERAEKVLEALGVDVDADDDSLDEAISKALKDKSADPALQKQIAKLKGKLSEQDTAHKAQIADERGKRFDGMKRTTLMEALTKNNADDPSLIVDMLLGKMVVSDEDESITFNDDKNSKVDDFVKEFLTAHPKLVANTQNPGAGSLLPGNKGGAGDDSPDVAFVKSMAKENAQSEGNAKALAGYFE